METLGMNCTGYYYCYTEDGSWDYCSQHIKRPRVTHYSKWGFPCLSSCHNFGGTSYNWCSTQQTMNWGECSKYDGYTMNDEQCSTACANRRENYFYCYKVTGGWDYCGKVEALAVSPIVIKIWQRPSGEYAAELPGQIDSSSNPSPDKVTVQFGHNQAYDGCGRTYRRRRVISQDCMWRPMYTERTLDGMFQAFRDQAEIRLGAPPETYNLVPQHPTVNRNVGAGNRPVEFFSSDWRSVENRMLTFFRAGQPGADGGHIRWRVVIFYRDENTGRHTFFNIWHSFIMQMDNYFGMGCGQQLRE
ncbi:hypothetical protein Fcan01_16906 [Folsomia candida]|uniref:Uncharacterized protein n=1 Tax=Folsomia candida TaxID=158441 RepID=A0A226DU27_FOLCA|nr:hypothetical protein Fcan01_16906 [Folsomia candida]